MIFPTHSTVTTSWIQILSIIYLNQSFKKVKYTLININVQNTFKQPKPSLFKKMLKAIVCVGKTGPHMGYKGKRNKTKSIHLFILKLALGVFIAGSTVFIVNVY